MRINFEREGFWIAAIAAVLYFIIAVSAHGAEIVRTAAQSAEGDSGLDCRSTLASTTAMAHEEMAKLEGVAYTIDSIVYPLNSDEGAAFAEWISDGVVDGAEGLVGMDSVAILATHMKFPNKISTNTVYLVMGMKGECQLSYFFITPQLHPKAHRFIKARYGKGA